MTGLVAPSVTLGCDRVQIRLDGGNDRQLRDARWYMFAALRSTALRDTEAIHRQLDEATITSFGEPAEGMFDTNVADQHLGSLDELLAACCALACGQTTFSLPIDSANILLEQGRDLAACDETDDHRRRAEHLLLFADLEEALAAAGVPGSQGVVE